MAELLPRGTTVALCGTLGAGKTRLVQAIAEASGVDRREVVSPTFVLVKEYHGHLPSGQRPGDQRPGDQRSIFHLDAYRLRDEDEFNELGPEEYFESDGLTLIEWADRVEGSLPADRIEIRIEVTGPESRSFEIRSIGTRYGKVIEGCRRRLGA